MADVPPTISSFAATAPSPSAEARPVVGVGGIAFDAGRRVLLIRRGQAPARGQWSLPGGRQEPGETMAEACRREFLEETGLSVTAGPIVAIVERMLEGFHYVIVDFLVSRDVDSRMEPTPADDVTDARWFALEDLSSLDLVTGLIEVIEAAAALADRNGGSGLRATTLRRGDYLAG